jgi:hypothetical protein
VTRVRWRRPSRPRAAATSGAVVQE